MDYRKTCFRCGEEMAITEFYHHPETADGHLGKCKACTKSDVKTNYADKRFEKSVYERARQATVERRSAKVEYMRKHNAMYPDRARARNAVNNAVRDGRIRRKSCEDCGAEKAQAHHHDYSRPLDVRWLCFRCHREHEHGQTVVAQHE